MSKVALITDQHWGVRNDNLSFISYFDKFYNNVFFPTLEKEGIKDIIMLGDTFDRRKYTNHNTLYQAKKMYFDKLKNYSVDCIIGNHCTYYKNTNEVNTPTLFLSEYSNIRPHYKPAEITIDGLKIALLPWVCQDNHDESMDFLDNTNAQILLGHLEIQGFEMYKGTFIDHGFPMEVFSKFDVVCSGHFHHKSTRGNINYLGSPYEMTWSDYNDPRGFHIFDTSTRELTYIQNPYRMFNKLYYDDKGQTLESVLDIDVELLKGSFIKLVVRNKTNPYFFDMFVDHLEKNGISDYQIVEDHFYLGMEEDAEILQEAEDTLTILKKVVEQLETSVEKKQLESLLSNLYQEAQYVEQV